MDMSKFIGTKFVLTLVFITGIDGMIGMLIWYNQVALVERYLLELLGLQVTALGAYTWANIQENKNGNKVPEKIVDNKGV